MKNSREVIEQRQQEICRLILENGTVSVEELAERFGVSPMTVRRDLRSLETGGRLARTHGGATAEPGALSAEEAAAAFVRRCRLDISKYAARFVEDGDALFINGSGTAIDLLVFAGDKKVTVFTNNCGALERDLPGSVAVTLTGGEVRSGVMVGEYVMRNLLELNADKTFMGCAVIYEDGEFGYAIPTEIGINELMVSRTGKDVYILADHTKLRGREMKDSAYGRCSYASPVTVITDSFADRNIVKNLEENGIRVLIAPQDKGHREERPEAAGD